MESVNTSTADGNNSLVVPEVLVGDEEAHAARDPLSEQIYVKLKGNRFFEAIPYVVQFAGYDLGNVHEQVVRIRNISGATKRIHVLPMSTPFFRILYNKRGKVAPGMSEEIVVTFIPNEWRYYYDRIRIHSEDENIMIPVHAYPTVSPVITAPFSHRATVSATGVGGAEYFPSKVDMGRCVLDKTVTRVIPITCSIPIEFEYKLRVLVPHPDMEVSPLEGIVPAEGHELITFTYRPSKMSTAEMIVEASISQFGFKPVRCSVIGSCGPGANRDATLNSLTRRAREAGADPSLESYAPIPEPGPGRPDLTAVHDQAKGFQDRVEALRASRRSGQPIATRRPEPPGPEPATEMQGYRLPAELHTRAAAQRVLCQASAAPRALSDGGGGEREGRRRMIRDFQGRAPPTSDAPCPRGSG
jgi:hypothetical protein